MALPETQSSRTNLQTLNKYWACKKTYKAQYITAGELQEYFMQKFMQKRSRYYVTLTHHKFFSILLIDESKSTSG